MNRWVWVWLLLTCPSLYAAGGDVVLIHANVHPVSGPLVPDATVVVKDGRIVSIGHEAAAAGVDVHGAQLYPSLIEANSTLGLIEILSLRPTHDEAETGPLNPNVLANVAFNPDSMLLPVAESAGILVAGVAPQGGVVSGRSAVMMLNGWTREDMTLKSPAGLYVHWPSMAVSRDPDAHPGVKEQEKRLREHLRYLKEAFANARAYLQARSVNGAQRPEEDVKWEAMGAAVRGEIPVVVEANRQDEIEAAVDWAQAEKLHLVIVGGADAWRCADKLAKARVGVIFTEEMRIAYGGSEEGNYGRDYEGYDTYYQAPATLVHAGVVVAISSGQAPAQVRDLRDTAGRAVAFGLSPDEALRSVTLSAAELLGVADRVGSLAVGKDATFFIADGDILDPRTHVLRAWVQGREVDLSQDRQKKLYEKYRARP